MAWIRGLLMMLFREYARGRIIGGVRRRGLRVYFRAVNGVRRLLVALVVVNVLIQLMITSLLALCATAAFLFVPDENTRLYVLGAVFLTLFLVPFVGGLYLLSESFWLKLSGAEGLIADPNPGE